MLQNLKINAQEEEEKVENNILENICGCYIKAEYKVIYPKSLYEKLKAHSRSAMTLNIINGN